MQVLCPSGQWPFQDPKLKVPTTYKAYVLGLCKRISPPNTAFYGAVPPFKDPEIPIDVRTMEQWRCSRLPNGELIGFAAEFMMMSWGFSMGSGGI